MSALSKIKLNDTVYDISASTFGNETPEEWDTKINNKQDTLTAGEGIKIENNVISLNLPNLDEEQF